MFIHNHMIKKNFTLSRSLKSAIIKHRGGILCSIRICCRFRPNKKNDLKKLRGRIFIYRAVRRVHLLPKIKNVRHLSNSPWSHKLNFMKTSGFHQYFRFHLYRKVIQSTRTHFLMTHGKFWYKNIVGFKAK